MNHLESSFTGRNAVWRYIVMFAAILLATNTIGALPLLLGYSSKVADDPELIGKIADDPGNLGVLGFEPNIGLLMNLFPFIIGILAFVLLIRPLNNRTFGATINGARRFRWDRFLKSALVWLILSALYLFVYMKADPSNFRLNNASGTLLPLILICLALIPFQAAFEEILFRGYLMQGFAVLFRNRWVPVVLTSVLFGLMHSFNPEVDEFGFMMMMPQYITFGLIFGIVTILDDGIEAATGAHAANNIFLCIMVTNKSSALQTDAMYEQMNVYPMTEFAGLLITGILFVVVMKMLLKWDSWSLLTARVEPPQEEAQSPYTDVLSSVR
ncbi:MAG: CPBP family intramembrane glutamic endopeptidase [Bacteroidales bacterium]